MMRSCARKQNSSLGISVTSFSRVGFAVAPREEIPSLVDEDGRLPKSLGILVARVSSKDSHGRHRKGICARRSKRPAAPASNPRTLTPTSITHARPGHERAGQDWLVSSESRASETRGESSGFMEVDARAKGRHRGTSSRPSACGAVSSRFTALSKVAACVPRTVFWALR